MTNGPEGVRITRADGSVIEAELVDEGIDEDGNHRWMIANLIYQVGDTVSCDVLPGRTSISFQARLPGLGDD